MTNYPLGKNQLAVLDALFTFGSYFKGCEWVYLYHSDTVETLEALVKRGLVHELQGHYFLTKAGDDAARIVNQFQKLELNSEAAA